MAEEFEFSQVKKRNLQKTYNFFFFLRLGSEAFTASVLEALALLILRRVEVGAAETLAFDPEL
jgi:hypothetical protein